jgi:hypothetical protein
LSVLQTIKFRCFRTTHAEYASLGLLIRKAESQAEQYTHRWTVPVRGVIADGEVGAGAMVPLGELVADGGVVTFTEIEPCGPEGEEL